MDRSISGVNSPRDKTYRTQVQNRFSSVSEAEQQIVAIAIETYEKGWREAAADRFSDVLGDALWASISNPRNGFSCAALAALASSIEGVHEKTRETLQGLATGAVDFVVPRTLETRTVMGLAAHRLAWHGAQAGLRGVPLPLEQEFAVISSGVRSLGIYICAFRGILANCACLRTVAEEVGRAHLKDALWKELESWR